MIIPRRGDEIVIIPYGTATVDKMIGEGRCVVTLHQIIKRPDGVNTNQVIVELHPVWTVAGMVPQ